MRQGLLAGMTLLLASCGTAQVAMAPPGQDAAGKQFKPPPPGLAAVYFYNPMDSGPLINVMQGAMVIGRLAPLTWIRIETSPGWYTMRCVTWSSATPSSITLAPGDMRFVEVERPTGAAACAIQETGPDAGRSGVLSGDRALQPQ
jgi:hypothetical protein